MKAAPEYALMTIAEVAELLRVSQRTVDRMRQEGTIIQPIKVGRQLRWRKSEILQWIDDGCPKVGR
jgi:excisionase family DNA binding protein